MTQGSNHSVYHHGMDESDMLLDDSEYGQFQMFPEEDEIVEGMMTPRAVHQCNICNKIFVSYKGLQQHAVIHTDQKPFRCDICSKSFRFKSNLFEHRSVHTGFTPHACPYCGKTCRLKGNLKKHLRTHVTTKEELEAAWRPFASNRRPPADIPEDAIIVRGAGGPYYTPPPRPKKKKLGLGEPEQWVNKLQNGEILPQVELDDKIRRLEDTIFNNVSIDSLGTLFDIAKSIAFETHECPTCKIAFMTRLDCMSHHSIEHENSREGLDYFCEKCFRPFADEASFQQHQSYHARVSSMFDSGAISRHEPDTLVPTPEEFAMLFDGSISEMMEQHHHM
uniref:C2H2-type domain-containing protein n=1 Tax=Caenorhabditis japonica TaxID=281687 RepID=A0A8R1E4P4_CAEJA